MQKLSSFNAHHFSALAGPLIAGFATYLILSYLFVPYSIAIPLAVILSILIYGLTKYYTVTSHKVNEKNSKVVTSNDKESLRHLQQQETGGRFENDTYTLSIFSTLFLVVVYSVCLYIVATHFFFFGSTNEDIFIPWERFSISEIVELGASIALCFFLPGYALLSVLHRDPDHKLGLVLKVLLAYIFSILITGLTGYAIASLGFGLSDGPGLFFIIYLTILIFLIIKLLLMYNQRKNKPKYFFTGPFLQRHTFVLIRKSIWNFLRKNNSELVVFGSLFVLIVLSTYYLYSGAIIGDQWYHHGRMLAFMSGEIRDIATAGADDKAFSPFPSAMLASFISVSGVPSVNAFASISFLNIVPVLAFYYFFKSCVPDRVKKAALLGCSLFMLSSGFGWVFALEQAIADPPESQLSALQLLSQEAIKSLDIVLPTSFLSAAHPDFSTPLIIMALPAGFTLLGAIAEKKSKQMFNFRYLAILLSIAFLGVLSHDEFYLFIIIASIIPIFYFLIEDPVSKKRDNYSVVYGALLGALLLTIVLSLYSFDGAGYYMYNAILGIPIILLSCIFVAVMYILYITTRFFYNLFYQKLYDDSKRYLKGFLSRPLIRSAYYRDLITFAARLVLISIIAWLYVITFIVWSESSVEVVETQTYDYTVPWYLYPLKLGVMGLLGIAFVLSYLFRRFEKEIFVFGIIVIVALVTGPYYDEHRFSKYIMAGLIGFASLFIYSLIIGSPLIKRNYRNRIVATSLILGIVIFSSVFSVFIFWGYNASAYDSGYDKALGRRDFPSASEFSLFRLLSNDSKNPLTFNVAAPSNEYAFHTGDLIGKVHAFSGIPWAKLTQSPLTLNASTLEGFYDLLHRSDTHYIVLPKKDFNGLITSSGNDGEAETSVKGGQEIGEDIDEDRIAGEENKQQGQQKTTLGDEKRGIEEAGVLPFAIENFQKAYEDEKYLVLAVPSLTSQQVQANIGLIIPESNLPPPSLLSDNNSIAMEYDNLFFPAEETSKLARSDKLENSTAGFILHGDKGETTTLWSNPLKQHQFQNSSYIEAVFRILGENKTSNDAGIIWNDGNKEYTASLRNDRLEILVKSTDVTGSNETSEKKLINVRDISRENGVWYRLKVITLENYINIYINDLLAATIPRDSNESDSKPNQQITSIVTPSRNGTSSSYPPISQVGIFSFNNIAEFKPIEIGKVQLQSYEKNRANFEHYYPMNMLALSKFNYETFIEGDPSVFSKKIIVLDVSSFDQLYSGTMNNTASKLSVDYEDGIRYPKNKTIDYNNNNTENTLLDFVKNGGTLVITNIINPDSTSFPKQTIFQNTELEKMLPFHAGDEVVFDRIGQNIVGDQPNKTYNIEAPRQDYLNISGEAQEIKIKNETSAISDFKVTSSYMHGNNDVAPFVLEKKYGAGKIIVINSGGYFRAIDSSPGQYFPTLAKIPGLIDLESVLKNNDKMFSGKALTPNAKPITRVVGELNMSGPSQINSSSMSIFADKIPSSAYSLENDKFHSQSTVLYPADNVSKRSNASAFLDTKLILKNNSYTIANVIIGNLSLVGNYEVTITSNNSLVLPSTLGSYVDYIAASIPPGSNMNIKLYDGAIAEFIAEKARHDQPFKILGNSKISFYNVSDPRDGNGLSVLLKSPKLKVDNGRASFEKIYTYDPDSKMTSDGGRLDVKGDMIAIFDHIDNYKEIDSNGGWINTKYLTYLNSIQFGKDTVYNKDKKVSGGFPGDISELAKEEGVQVPWEKALLSPMAVTMSLSIIIVTVVTLIIFWRTAWLKQK